MVPGMNVVISSADEAPKSMRKCFLLRSKRFERKVVVKIFQLRKKRSDADRILTTDKDD